MLSVIVPAYNESRRLPASLERMRAYFDTLGEEYELIVVDDGSTDSTAAIVEERQASWPELRLVRLRRNSGKGWAVREGMLAASGEHRLFSDADLSTPLEELPRLREKLEGDCHVAIASRALPGATLEVHQPWRREFMGRTYNRMLRVVALPGLHDTQCGFKVFTADAAVACFTPLKTRRFGFDSEVLLRARKRGWRIAEVPVRWSHVEDSRVSALRDSVRTFWDLLRLRFLP